MKKGKEGGKKEVRETKREIKERKGKGKKGRGEGKKEVRERKREMKERKGNIKKERVGL